MRLRELRKLVEQVVAGGGGGGLVVGTWAEIDLGGPNLLEPFDLDPVEAPAEVELQWVPQPNQSGGYVIMDSVSGEEYDMLNGSYGPDESTKLQVMRCVVPPGAHVQIVATFGSTGDFIVQRLRRRTLG